MAVLSVVTCRVRPGRMAEFVDAVKQIKEIEERVGTNLKGVRLFEAWVGGPQTQAMAIFFEYEDLASWGATVDSELKERTFQMLHRSEQPGDEPDEVVDKVLYVEVPL